MKIQKNKRINRVKSPKKWEGIGQKKIVDGRGQIFGRIEPNNSTLEYNGDVCYKFSNVMGTDLES